MNGSDVITRQNVEIGLSAPKSQKDVSVVVIPPPAPQPRASSTTGSYEQTGSIGASPNKNTQDYFLSSSSHT